MEVFVTKAVLVVFLLCSLPVFAQSKDPGYDIQAHIVESHIDSGAQYLTAVINGSKYELKSANTASKGVVALGDYKAKLIAQQQKPTHEFTKIYNLLFPDGSFRAFLVIGQME